MPSNYKLSFWDISVGGGDVGAPTRAQVAKAALTLQDHPDVIFSSSAGGYGDEESLEIAILLPVEYSPISLQPVVERAVINEGLTTRIHLKSDVRWYDFDEAHLASIGQATFVPDVDRDAVRSQIDTLVDLPRVAPSPGAAARPKELVQQIVDFLNTKTLNATDAATAAHIATLVSDFPPEALLEEVSVSADKYERMKKARGGDIEAEVKNLQDSLTSLSKETSTNAAVLLMIASGLITVGKAMWTAYTAIQAAGGLVPMITGLIASVGGIAEVVAIAVVVAILIGILWALLKP